MPGHAPEVSERDELSRFVVKKASYAGAKKCPLKE